jgi:glycine hydroxymethyltransferase
MTTRGCVEVDFETIAEFLLRAANTASNMVREHGKIQKDLLRGLQNNSDIIDLRNQVEAFASQFAMPGFDV